MNKETTERQEHQIGVHLRTTGTVQLVGNRRAAEDRARQLNMLAQQIGAGPVAEVVTRRVTVVTTITGTPWQVTP